MCPCNLRDRLFTVILSLAREISSFAPVRLRAVSAARSLKPASDSFTAAALFRDIIVINIQMGVQFRYY